MTCRCLFLACRGTWLRNASENGAPDDNLDYGLWSIEAVDPFQPRPVCTLAQPLTCDVRIVFKAYGRAGRPRQPAPRQASAEITLALDAASEFAAGMEFAAVGSRQSDHEERYPLTPPHGPYWVETFWHAKGWHQTSHSVKMWRYGDWLDEAAMHGAPNDGLRYSLWSVVAIDQTQPARARTLEQRITCDLQVIFVARPCYDRWACWSDMPERRDRYPLSPPGGPYWVETIWHALDGTETRRSAGNCPRGRPLRLAIRWPEGKHKLSRIETVDPTQVPPLTLDMDAWCDLRLTFTEAVADAAPPAIVWADVFDADYLNELHARAVAAEAVSDAAALSYTQACDLIMDEPQDLTDLQRAALGAQQIARDAQDDYWDECDSLGRLDFDPPERSA